MPNHQLLGKLGEEAAVNYLKKHKYQIICCNYRTRYGEIDIIATHHKILVFIEVKTRRNISFGSPQEAVTPFKQQRIRAMAESYLQQNASHLPIRFDVVAVLGTVVQGKLKMDKIEIIQNAF